MNLLEFLELFFIVAGGMAMPFIVIGSYFQMVPAAKRHNSKNIFFLIISIVYALSYSRFAWKGLRKNPRWKNFVDGRK